MEKKSFAFDILNGGLGFLNACYLASVLIQTKAVRRILITASEVENNAKPVPDCLRGLKETASAIMLDAEQEGDKGFGAFHFKFFPEEEDKLSVYASTKQLQIGGYNRARLHISKASDLDQRMICCIADTLTDFFATEGIAWEDIAVVLPPQISSGFISNLAAALEIDEEKFVNVSCPEGDLFTSSLPYSFAAATKNGTRAKPGDLGLIINVASGIEVGCAIYHF